MGAARRNELHLMLLRRISENLKSQSWTAVFLDLLIVVLGIFLGLQASQWYESRQEVALEESILDRLRVEFDDISEVASSAIRFHQDEIVALELISQALRSGSLAPGNEEQFGKGLSNAMGYDLGPSRSGTYVEILSSGQFRLLRNQKLREALSKYDDRVLKAGPLFSGFQFNQRKYETIFNRHLVRDPVSEHSNDSVPTGVMFLHGGIIEFDFDEMSEDVDFLDSIQRLIEYHTNFQFWHAQIYWSADEVVRQLHAGRS